MLENGQKAPDFSCPDQNNQTVSLSDHFGSKNIVLYFYPKDDTPGCTIEANQFTALNNEFTAADTIVYGVSKDGCDSHVAFIDKFNLSISLLADTDGTLCKAYDTWQEKEKNGVKKMGIVRSTFVIDKQGILRFLEYGVSADGHAQQILDFIRAEL